MAAIKGVWKTPYARLAREKDDRRLAVFEAVELNAGTGPLDNESVGYMSSPSAEQKSLVQAVLE
jgi:hypothetical protein